MCYEDVGVQWLWDFEVAHTHNYICAGVVHHNTQTACAEVAIHMTGLYPPWWEGIRFKKPVSVWTGCESNELSKDIVQFGLLGPEGEHGTGWLPKSTLGKVTYRQSGVKEVVDTIKVHHVSGGLSTVTLKTYHAGKGEPSRRQWQGTSRDLIWLDEEPPPELYTEALTRILDSNGRLMLTFTPLQGATSVVNHFINGADITEDDD
jgi:phage terminase large subunit-like protein